MNFERYNYSVPFTGATYVNEAVVEPLIVPSLRADAFDQWELGGGSGSLVGLVAERNLVQQDGAHPVVWSPNYLTTEGGGQYGLNPGGRTDLGDQTLFGVFRYQAVVDIRAVYFGSAVSSAAAGGELCYQASTARGIVFMTRGFSTSFVYTMSPEVDDGDWIFLAASHRSQVGEVLGARTMFIGGHQAITQSGNKTVRVGGGTGFGARTYADPDLYRSVSIAGAGIIDRYMTPDEIQMLYLETKHRMRARGVEVF